MKKLISASLFVLFLSGQVFAATAAVKGTRLAEKKSTSTRSSTVTRSHTSDPWRIGVGPSTGIVNGSFTFGASGDVRYQITPVFEIGGETGIYHLSNVWFIPFMASGIFHPDLDTGNVHFYAGVSVGFNIAFISSPIFGVSGATRAYFQGMLRPGLEFNVGDNLRMFAEAKFGIVNSSFAFLPTAGFLFTL